MARDRDRSDRRDDRDDGHRGAGHQFLDLEISKVLAGDAARLARKAFAELLVERIKAHLAEEIGERLDALAQFAAEDLLSDIETNLEIERHIETRKLLNEAQNLRIRSILLGEEDDEEDGEKDGEIPF